MDIWAFYKFEKYEKLGENRLLMNIFFLNKKDFIPKQNEQKWKWFQLA